MRAYSCRLRAARARLAAVAAPFSRALRGLGFALFLGPARAGILALGFGVAVDQLDQRHRGIVAIAIAGLDDAGVAAGAVRVTLRQGRHQLVGQPGILQRGDRAAAVGEAAMLAERDQPLDERAQILGLWQGRPDLLVLDQRGGEVLEHRLAVGGFAAEAPAAKTMAHGILNRARRGAWPIPRCSRAASSGFPCRDGAPSGPAPP